MPHTRYHRLFETARDGILVLDYKSKKIIDANPLIASFVNIPYADILHKTPFQIGLFRSKKEMENVFSNLNKQNEVSFEGISIKNKSGEIKNFKLLANLYHENNRQTIQCNIREITDRKQYERELFESNQRLEALMNALPVGVSFSSDTSCEFITGNPALLNHLELKPGDNISVSSSDKDASGSKLKHYINGRLISSKEMPMQRSIMENREIGPIEIDVKLPSGKIWTTEARSAPIRDAQGNVVASVAVNVDLTERKRAEEANRLERLMEQEKLKINFIADATHELRTPLAIIKGHVDLALRTDKSKLSTSVRDSLSAINNEINYLANLISDLTLLVSDKDAKFQRDSGNKKVELINILTRTIQRHQSFADKKRIKIKTSKLSPTYIRGDEGYLERLFANIIINAISYGKKGGNIWISASKNSREIRIDIKDDGVGIPEKDLPLIFERFYRVDSSRSKDSGGSGLGLAIVKWIAEAHGGRVTATSLAEKGSTFSVTFPLNTIPNKSVKRK